MGRSLFIELKYEKYFRKTSLKQKNIGDLFLEEIQKSNPKSFLEIAFTASTPGLITPILFSFTPILIAKFFVKNEFDITWSTLFKIFVNRLFCLEPFS